MSLLKCHLFNRSVYVQYDLPETLCSILMEVDSNLDQVELRDAFLTTMLSVTFAQRYQGSELTERTFAAIGRRCSQ